MWIQRIWFPNFPNQRTFSHFPPHGRWYSTHTWTHAHKQSGEPFLTSFICVFRSIEVTAVWFALSVCLHRDSGLPQVTSACPTHTSIETVDIVTEWCKAHSESQVFDPRQGCWPTSLHTCTTECVKDAGSFIESQDEHSVVTVLKPDMMTVPHRDLSLIISNCVCAQSSFILCGLIHLHFPWCIYWKGGVQSSLN